MTEQDLLQMLILAYEQGLEDGKHRAELEMERQDTWEALKDACVLKMTRLTTL